MNNLLAVLTGVLVGSLVNVFVNFEGKNKPLVKWYFRLYYQDTVAILTNVGLGLISYFIYTTIGLEFYSFSYFILIALLCAACIKDIQNRIIPNKLIVFGLISAVILHCLFFSFERITNSLVSLALAGGILLVTSLVSKGGVGMGDVKLVSCTGMLIGIERMISVLIVSFITSALFGIFLMLIKRFNRKSSLPFAPFVLLGVVFTLLIT